MKSYLNDLPVNLAGIKFKYRVSMLPFVKMCYKSEPKYLKSLWKCTACGLMDTIQHLAYCIGYEHMRVDKDLSDDFQLCVYLSNIIKEREVNEC